MGSSPIVTTIFNTMKNIQYYYVACETPDEQSNDRVPDPAFDKAYMINVASYRNGVGYGKWVHLDGWSESIVDYILEFERTKDR